MNTFRLLLRSLRFYGRTHLGVVLGVLLASAILTGALAVGDSVRHTLLRQALARLGATVQAMASPDEFFRADLATDIAKASAADAAPVLLLPGTAVRPDGTARANGIQVIGAGPDFWKIGGTSDLLAGAESDEAAINTRLARQLGVNTGDAVVVRVEMPSFVPRDAPLSGRSDQTAALRVRVRTILDDESLGRFGLQAGQVPPANLFVPLAALQNHVKRPARANVILSAATSDLAPVVTAHWKLADAGLAFRPLPNGAGLELRTDRVFLMPATATAAHAAFTNATGVLAYFANEIRLGTNATPYSFVAATGADLRDDEITVNQWLADDLGARVGDPVNLRYYAIGDRRELIETSAVFRVAAIVPTVADDSWMPAFPGLAEVVDCRKWDPGIPVDATRIRTKDETYWKDFRGTPKAFLSLKAGQRLWSNRFGELTAIRIAGEQDPGQASALLRERIDPATVGLFFTPVRELAVKAGSEALDFGQLFIGFSFFLIVAALALAAMLFVFSLEQRHAETGLLRALGFTAARVRRLLLAEGTLLAAAGSMLGILPGLAYTKLALLGLSSVWSGAVGGGRFHFAARPATMIIGAVSTVVCAVFAMWLAQRRQFRRPVAELLARSTELEFSGAKLRARTGTVTGVAGLLLAVAMLVMARGKHGAEAAEVFFGAGSCLLLAGLGFAHRVLAAMSRAATTAHTLSRIGLRSAARRPGRTLTSVGVLASGLFLVLAISAFHHEGRHVAGGRASGTGGFALFARSAMPVHDDLNTAAGRAVFGIDKDTADGIAVVALRVRTGDEASCLNLNRAQQPSLWGVNPAALGERQAFSFASADGAWSLLDGPVADDIVPAIGDLQTVMWSLGRKVGDLIPTVDEQGRAFRLRIVGTVAPSILQGGLLISERNFVARFPSSAGSRMFLIDAPPDRTAAVATEWMRALGDRGFEAVPAAERLADFLAVENTYLSIFQALGGLGLLLGSIGFGIVAVRNGLERRRELALLKALGFDRDSLRHMLMVEHAFLLLLGTAMGIASAALAIAPALATSHTSLPVGLFAAILAGILTIGSVAVRIAARAALCGPLLASLRNE